MMYDNFRINYILLSIFAVLHFSISLLHAREFKIISLNNFPGIEKIKFQDESATQRLTITKYFPNRSFPIPKNNLIHFYGFNSDTRTYSKRPNLRISFEHQKKDTIVLLKPEIEDPSKIDYEFLDNDITSFPLVSTLVLNLSEKQVFANIAGDIISLPPSSQKLIPLPKNERGSFSDKVVFAAQRNDLSIDYFYSSFWRVPAGNKTLCIIDYDKESDLHKLNEILL